VALTRTATKAANSQGSRSPSQLAWMMLMSLTPLMSLSTLLSCTFISIKTFCNRWMALLAISLPRCRQKARAMRIASVG
jgi:hypothetical protein